MMLYQIEPGVYRYGCTLTFHIVPPVFRDEQNLTRLQCYLVLYCFLKNKLDKHKLSKSHVICRLIYSLLFLASSPLISKERNLRNFIVIMCPDSDSYT